MATGTDCGLKAGVYEDVSLRGDDGMGDMMRF